MPKKKFIDLYYLDQYSVNDIKSYMKENNINDDDSAHEYFGID